MNDRKICIENAREHLRKARYWLRAGQAPKTLAKVNSAIASADGAIRHAMHDDIRAERQQKAAAK